MEQSGLAGRTNKGAVAALTARFASVGLLLEDAAQRIAVNTNRMREV